MRSILVTNHKGGVGKTFASVHMATYWGKVQGRRVLLVDCDGQYDAYRFLTNETPKEFGPVGFAAVTDTLHVIPNHECKSLKAIDAGEETYDFVILDSDARLADSVKNILQNEISMVVAPVKDSLSTANLPPLMEVIKGLYGLAGDAAQSAKQSRDLLVQRVMLLPLGADLSFLGKTLAKLQIRTRLKANPRMNFEHVHTDLSLRERKVLWELEAIPKHEQEQHLRYFGNLASNIEKFLANLENVANG